MEKRGDITEDTPLSEHDRGHGWSVKAATADKFAQDLASRAKAIVDEKLAKDNTVKND